MERLRACGCISMGLDTHCGHCGRQIKYGEKYAYVSNWSNSSGKAMRYCGECSVKLGYMHWVRNLKTGKVFASIYCLQGEEVIADYETVDKEVKVNARGTVR